MSDFSNLSYKTGDFLFHEYYGVGKITSISDFNRSEIEVIEQTPYVYDIHIEFSDHVDRVFTNELVMRSMQRLSSNGFRVMMQLDQEEARSLLENKPVEAIKKVLQDFPEKRAKTEQIKSYLQPYIDNWEEWWKKVQSKLKESDWIDSSQSRQQIYGINPFKLSPADEFYQNYRMIRRGGAPDEIYSEAKKALAQIKPDPCKDDDRLEDLVAYFNSSVTNEQLSINNRLDAIFRLDDGHWITAKRVEDYIQTILRYNFFLYDLELYPLNRLVERLLAYSKDERIEQLLLSGICGNELTIKAVSDWAKLEGDINMISVLVITALRSNLPDDESTTPFITIFKFRLKTVREFINYLPNNFQDWEKIVSCLSPIVRHIANLKNEDNQRLIMTSLLDFTGAVIRRLRNLDDVQYFEAFNALVNPDLSIDFILNEFAAIKHLSNPSIFENLEKHFEDNLQFRKDDILDSLLAHNKLDDLESVKKSIFLFHKFPKSHIANLAINKILSIAKSSRDDQIVNLIPYLDQLERSSGNPIWKKDLDGLREKAYLALLNENNIENGYKDDPLIQAVNQVVFKKTAHLSTIVHTKDELIKKLDGEKVDIERLLKERDVIITELRSRPSGNVTEARFKERSKILIDLVTSLAEFERFQASQDEKSKEIEAVLKRFTSILSGYNVSTSEGIGMNVKFNTNKHHSLDSTVLKTGDNVIIIERGYFIRDFDDNLRLLKPALVRKV